MRICPLCGATHAVADWRCPACGRQPERRDCISYFAPALATGDGSDASYQHAELFEAEDSHFWFRARTKLLLWAVARHFPDMRSLLDVGCGRGAILAAIRRAFPSAACAGGELLEAGLRLAQSRLREVDLYQVDARTLPFDAEFDVVISCDVLEHIDDDQAVVDGLFRAVVPGGGIIVTVPQHQWLWSAVDVSSHHRRRYDRRGLVALLERGGFAVERVTSFVTVLLPLMLVSRVRRRTGTGDFDAAAELRIGVVANQLLERALDVERWIIRAGVSLPIGGSLLVVARRPKRRL